MGSDLESVYWIVGAMVVASVGTIGATLFAAAKGIWWLSKLDSRVKQNTKDVNEAHSKVRQLREFVSEL